MDRLPISISEAADSAFSRSSDPKKYRPEDLKARGTGNTARTNAFEQELVAIYRKIGKPVPYEFKATNGEVRSLDAGCLSFLAKRNPPAIEFSCDQDGYIVAVKPLQTLSTKASLSAAEVESILREAGFTRSPTSKVIRFDHSRLSSPVYVKIPEPTRNRVRFGTVIHPALERLVDSLPNVARNTELYHHSHLRAFPTKTHRGKTEQHFGIALDFSDQQSLRDFLSRLFGEASFPSAISPDVLDDIRSAKADLDRVGITERDAIVKARVGQGKFRADLVAYWQSCALTGVADEDLLRASHIKPWRDSSNQERLDVHNGLLLTPNLDVLFDRGFITFDDAGGLVLSRRLSEDARCALGVSENLRLRKIDLQHHKYLKWHRTEVFKQS